jgi:3-dehydroquinate synthase
MMQKIKVNLPLNNYEIRIGPGLLGNACEALSALGFKGKLVIITNPVIKGLYGDGLQANLEAAGFDVSVLEVSDGEHFKSLEQAGKLYLRLIDVQAERMTPVLALGGGVIGDLVGFVSATYMRGVPLIQIPTTFLSQVDSSIGGKVAVNHGRLKNNIGAFYQPKMVITDVSTLKTLPEKELINGLAEAIKYGIICDQSLFQIIESKIEQIKCRDEGILTEVICRCAGIKVAIVEKDEKDTGLRNVLNYGHTIGHAIETVSDFRVTHGQGVSIGMVAAGLISRKMGILSDSDLNRIKSVLIKSDLPVKIPDLDIHELWQALKHDKKKVEGKIRFILPKSIGEVFVCEEVSTTLIEQVLREMHEKTQDLRHDYRK